MSWLIEDRIDENHFREVCKNAKSMAQAASQLGLHFNSFKKRALELECYKPNKAGIGIRKNAPKIPIEDIIFNNKHTQYQSYKLKLRLIEEEYKKNICESCGIEEWNGKSIQMELHHVDGNRVNHNISNLQILCPNCHSQTDNFRAKNKSN
ncbi:HNH endonuclease signature motif containing protein [Bernardetia sp. MNP-M8]|uniref:HNH endonuclease signature motif containing protein n=1 Tax=Bernardetia sp. MNP-M8 TaxID=3127470 RepID=UPI0030CBD10F